MDTAVGVVFVDVTMPVVVGVATGVVVSAMSVVGFVDIAMVDTATCVLVPDADGSVVVTVDVACDVVETADVLVSFAALVDVTTTRVVVDTTVVVAFCWLVFTVVVGGRVGIEVDGVVVAAGWVVVRGRAGKVGGFASELVGSCRTRGACVVHSSSAFFEVVGTVGGTVAGGTLLVLLVEAAASLPFNLAYAQWEAEYGSPVNKSQ